MHISTLSGQGLVMLETFNVALEKATSRSDSHLIILNIVNRLNCQHRTPGGKFLVLILAF